MSQFIRPSAHREKTRGNRQLCGVGVGPTKGLSEKSLNRSLSSINIHYNHTLTRALSSTSGRRTGLVIFYQPEVVLNSYLESGMKYTRTCEMVILQEVKNEAETTRNGTKVAKARKIICSGCC